MLEQVSVKDKVEPKSKDASDAFSEEFSASQHIDETIRDINYIVNHASETTEGESDPNVLDLYDKLSTQITTLYKDRGKEAVKAHIQELNNHPDLPWGTKVNGRMGLYVENEKGENELQKLSFAIIPTQEFRQLMNKAETSLRKATGQIPQDKDFADTFKEIASKGGSQAIKRLLSAINNSQYFEAMENEKSECTQLVSKVNPDNMAKRIKSSNDWRIEDFIAVKKTKVER